jgi:formylglycine-generating enzyme required for sulfatase activity
MAKFLTTIAEDDRFRMVNGRPLYDVDFRRRRPELYKSNFPAYSKSWQEAKDYCQWLGALSGLPVDLSTEAQYEYAARSRGRHLIYATDNGSINEGRNYRDPAARRKTGEETYPVDRYPPNPLGLYDMTGNAYSWVNDWYDPTYYQHSPVDNPQGPPTGTEKVLRGGDVLSSPGMTIWRGHDKPVLREYYLSNSFRCAIQQSGPLK